MKGHHKNFTNAEFLKQGHAFQKGVIGETVNMLLLRGITQQQKNDEQIEIIFLYYGFLLKLNRKSSKDFYYFSRENK